jgi:hypothetical protein
MDTRNWTKIGFVAVATILTWNSDAFAQQWQGPLDTFNTIGRWGAVGIGTLSPTQKLHVREFTAGANPNLRIEDSKGDGIHVGYNTGGNWGALNSNTGGNFFWDTLTWQNGRVGIGGTPWEQVYTDGEDVKPLLTVHGNIRVEDVPVWNTSSDNDLTWGAGLDNGIGYSPQKLLISREGSSLRYKQKVQSLDDNFSKILNVMPRKYQMREGYGPKDLWSFGYVAEELDAAGLQNLVIYDSKGRPDGVKYKKVVIYVTEVVKSQQKTIQHLEAEVDELKKLVNESKR